MGDAIVDDTNRILSEADMESKCPKCGSRKMLVSYSRDFVVELDKEDSYEALGSGVDPSCITCFACGETFWEE